MNSIFNKSNLIGVLLISLVSKSFFYPPNISDAISLFALSLLFGLNIYISLIDKPDYSSIFSEKLDDLENQRDKQLEQMAELYEQRIRVVEDKISTLNLTVTKKPLEKQSFGW